MIVEGGGNTEQAEMPLDAESEEAVTLAGEGPEMGYHAYGETSRPLCDMS